MIAWEYKSGNHALTRCSTYLRQLERVLILPTGLRWCRNMLLQRLTIRHNAPVVFNRNLPASEYVERCQYKPTFLIEQQLACIYFQLAYVK